MEYRKYLRSPAWHARRREWFEEEQKRKGEIRCAVLGTPITNLNKAELHHLDYSKVTKGADGRWIAGEGHEDLLAMTPVGHETVHRLLDRDRGLNFAGNRVEATYAAIRLARIRLVRAINEEA